MNEHQMRYMYAQERRRQAFLSMTRERQEAWLAEAESTLRRIDVIRAASDMCSNGGHRDDADVLAVQQYNLGLCIMRRFAMKD